MQECSLIYDEIILFFVEDVFFMEIGLEFLGLVIDSECHVGV